MLNYLQQAQGQPQQAQTPASGMGQNAYASPTQMLQTMQPSRQSSAAPSNPFDRGIRYAVESARESLGMTQKQQDKAMRSSMLAFANNMAQQPKKRGFWNNVGSVGQALAPAVGAYDMEENNALAENNNMANQILSHQAAEQDRQAQEEERAWRRQYAEDQLGEQRRQHNLMDNFRRDKAQEKEGSNIIEIEGRPFRKLDKIEQRQANKLKSNTSNNALALKDIKESFENLKKLTANNTFAPIGGLSVATNKAKDFFGRFAANKELREETAARNNFESQLGKLTTSLEAIKAGGGKLGQGMYDRLKPFFPSTDDDLPTLEAKLQQINGEANKYNQAAQISSKYGISFDPADVDELFGEQETAATPLPSQMDGVAEDDNYGFTDE